VIPAVESAPVDTAPNVAVVGATITANTWPVVSLLAAKSVVLDYV